MIELVKAAPFGNSKQNFVHSNAKDSPLQFFCTKINQMPSLRLYSNERVELLPFGKPKNGIHYALTNYGRIISFTDTPANGKFLKPAFIRGYPAMSFSIANGRKTFLLHRLVGEYFLKRPSPQHKFIIHLNHKKEDNYANNLKWATAEEKKHASNTDRQKTESGNYKLTAGRVLLIKKKMLDGKTRLKIIAKQFGVSDMQIHRIKTGENWGHVKV